MTAERCCQTCRRAYCCQIDSECLSGGPAGGPYPYRCWEAGDPAAELHAGELLGAIPIHMDGEADVTNGQPPARECARLRAIAEQCGYMVYGPCYGLGERLRLDVYTREGAFRVWWEAGNPDKPGKVAKVLRLSSKTGDVLNVHWQP